MQSRWYLAELYMAYKTNLAELLHKKMECIDTKHKKYLPQIYIWVYYFKMQARWFISLKYFAVKILKLGV